MVIKTYKADTLEEKETITKTTSVIWNSRFYDTGSFEIHTTSQAFEAGDLLAYEYNGIIKCGIIMKVFETLTDITVTGYDLKGIFNFRYITSLIEYNNIPAETVIKNLAVLFLKTGDREISKLVISPDAGKGPVTEFSAEKQVLSEALKSFCLKNEIGISVEFEFDCLRLDTKIGSDRSNTVCFGRRLRNIENLEYTQDLFNTYNVCYSVDENENETITGTEVGIFRRECYTDKNVDEYLKEKSEIETLRAEVNERYIFGKDYFLGDYVSLEHRQMRTVKQITEVKEVHEAGKHMVIPILGTEKENPIKRLIRST